MTDCTKTMHVFVEQKFGEAKTCQCGQNKQRKPYKPRRDLRPRWWKELEYRYRRSTRRVTFAAAVLCDDRAKHGDGFPHMEGFDGACGVCWEDMYPALRGPRKDRI